MDCDHVFYSIHLGHGFNSVYRVLQELFPQVDTRMLRAVAIEHSKDADTAVEVVLVEVIPHLSKGREASDSSNAHVGDVNHPASPEDALQVASISLDETVGTMNGSSSYDASAGGDQVCVYKGNEELVSLEKHEKGNGKVIPDVTPHVTLNPIVHESSGDDDCNRACVNSEGDEIISRHESSNVKLGSDHGSNVSLTTSKHGSSCPDGSMNVILLDGWERFDGPFVSDCIHVESRQELLCLDDNKLEVENSVVQLDSSSVQECKLEGENSVVQLAPSSVQECTSAAAEGCAKQVVMHRLSNECEPEANGISSDVASKKEIIASELVDAEPMLNTVVTRSGQICRIDLLEDIIEDARNNKKTLFSAMESVLSLMKEVELQEKAAEQAKEEAARGGLDILSRVEDLKEMLQHAKEANDMHAGEVYGERAILATEVRELQSRLLSLSDERDKSLAILDEMCLNLEERLDVAEKERKAAEQEKMEKVESARNALAEQELIMEKVVQESKRLEQEAEENSKLREFLVDRGRVVDMLQGEISVICQDVKFLKVKFDERVPLSKSLSSSQTSCILASSSSSLKSMAPDQVTEQAESSESPKKKNSPSPSVDDQLFSGEEKAGTGSKALVDDGWEFFDTDV